MAKLRLDLLGKSDDDVAVLVYSAVDTTDFYLPLESHLVELAISHQIVVDLGK